MNQNFPLCFEIAPKRITQDNTYQSDIRKEILQSQQQVMRSLTRVASNFTFSIRYFYNPDQTPKIKTYLLLNQAGEYQTEEISEQVVSLLTKGKFSDFFTLKLQADFNQYQKLDWVNFIGEIFKDEEFIEPQNYYLPHLFEVNQSNDMSAVYDVINHSDRKLILEITLQTYQNSYEKQLWVNAINQMLTQLDTVNSNSTSNKDNLLSTTLALYQKYQQLYPNGDLFKYSIKALAENRGDARVVLETLINHATKENHHGKQCQIVLVNKDQPGFLESLQATENVDISTAIEWSGWQKKFSEMVIKEVIKPKIIGKDKAKENSLSISFMLPPPTPKALNPAQNQNKPGESDAVLGGSPLAKFSSPPPSRIIDLKPLHRLATSQEISGFFRIAVPKPGIITMTFPTATAEEIFNSYRHLIEEDNDTYIVGIDDEGNPVLSSWAKTSHRLVAGVPGAGKSNFLNWIIYQFLYANPKGKIYIADFAGADFNFLVDRVKANVEIITTVEECQNLVEKIHSQEHQRRLELLQKYEVHNITELQEEGVDIQRTLWIIDEAADIADASSKLRDTIEKRLKEYARKGRKFGIHIIYCTQRPTAAIITPQVTDQCEEKVIFRVSREASQSILEDSMAGDIPITSRGRAVLQGYAGKMFVNTPLIKVPVGSKIQVADTLWSKIVERS
ncbi:FtsK/SpoIIIE domain-containing protein [Aerosakkonema sp. BLCC-F183]|uniref:FtsK/SpoIIIE domain-containing protein n=1 Tax=Aerosakkonema sp. BLCC-F183 TaxID=3342834 RepID=UPI0035BA0CA8